MSSTVAIKDPEPQSWSNPKTSDTHNFEAPNIQSIFFLALCNFLDFYAPDMGLNQTPNYPNLDQPQIEVEQILYRHPYNQTFVYA